MWRHLPVTLILMKRKSAYDVIYMNESGVKADGCDMNLTPI